MKILDGTHVAHKIAVNLKKQIEQLPGHPPGLAFIRIGEDPASKVYIEIKKKKCKEIGIHSFDVELPSSVSNNEVMDKIAQLNSNSKVDGILLQLPIPSHLSAELLIEQIDPKKDVDGFHPLNMGRLLLGDLTGQIACTPLGIHLLLVDANIQIQGKHVVIVGRSNIVGKPLAALLMQKHPLCNATVTVVNRESNLEDIAKQADILIAAAGSAKLIKKSMVKEGATVIDVGIHRVGNLLVGDVDFDDVAPICSYITKVPGGVGPMTVAALMRNTLQARKH